MTAPLSSTLERRRPASTGASVVVVGGGYAGVMAANRIAACAGRRASVVLVTERDELVHRVRLHELLAGTRTRRYPLDTVLHPKVVVRQGRVERIDADGLACELAGGGRLPYDQLVVCIGSRIDAHTPGALACAMALTSPDAALTFAARVRALPAGARIAVVGGGLTAIEVACELADAHPRLRVTLIAEALQLRWPVSLEERLLRELDTMGVELTLGARALCVSRELVELSSGERVPAAEIVWAAGFRAAPLAAESGLRVDELGRAIVDETLRVPGHPEIVVAGDAAAAPVACTGTGITPMRMACATAMPMGAHAADVVVDQLAGRTPLRFRYRNTVQCVSVGRRRGMLVLIDQDDRPTGRVVAARPGAWAKEVICRSVIGALRLERRVPAAFVWPGRFARDRHDGAAALPEGLGVRRTEAER